MLNFLKNKNFWLTVAHVATAGGSAALAIAFPVAVPAIIPVQALINGLIPSPLNPPSTVIVNPPSVISTHQIAQIQTGTSTTNFPAPTPIGLTISDELNFKDKVE